MKRQLMMQVGRPSMGMLGVAALLTMFGTGCGVSGPAGGQAPEPEPTVADHLGVVDDYTFLLHPEYERRVHAPGTTPPPGPADPMDEIWLTPAPEGWDLRVVWAGGVCNPAPTLEMAGQASGPWEITIHEGPTVLQIDDVPPGVEVACPSVGVVHAIDLRTSVPPPDDISVVLVLEDGQRR